MAVVVLLAGAYLAVWTFSGLSGSVGEVNPGGAGQVVPSPLILTSVARADSLVNGSIAIPQFSVYLGSSYRVIGVEVDMGGNWTSQGQTSYVTVTLANGTVYRYPGWRTSAYIWDGQFRNGSTTADQVLSSGGVEVTESPSPPGVNSTRSAEAFISGTVQCVTETISGETTQTTCQTASGWGGTYITKFEGFALIVNPSSGTVTWLDDRGLHWFSVTSNSVGIDELLAMAETMIQ